MQKDNRNEQCDMLKRIENGNLRACEIGMLKYNGIQTVDDLNKVVNGLYQVVINDPVILKGASVIRVIKSEHGINIYSKPCPARAFGFKTAPNCDIASVIAKRVGSLFPNYTTEATKRGGFTQHLLTVRGRKTLYKHLTMISPALLIREGFGGEYHKEKTKSRVLKTYKGLD